MMSHQPLKIIFAGTPSFSATVLAALLQSPHQVIAVYTQPDRPSGRGQLLTPSPVKELALKHQLPVHQPVHLKDETEREQMRAYQADLLIVVAYGLIIPKAILDIPTYGGINVHASLLPRWRGAAPIQHAILSGDTETGISIMQMDPGLDTGDVLYTLPCTITEAETTETLQTKLAELGVKALLHTLEMLIQDKLRPVKQNNSQAIYAAKITKQSGVLDWNESAIKLERMVRAYIPWPVATATIQNQTFRIFKAKPLKEMTTSLPGTVIRANREGLDIATKEGVLRILELQRAGGKRLKVAEFLNANQNFLNTSF